MPAFVLRLVSFAPPRLELVQTMHAMSHAGNTEMVRRIARRSPMRAARITWGFITKDYTRSAASAKDLFFSDDIPAADLDRCELVVALDHRPPTLGRVSNLLTGACPNRRQRCKLSCCVAQVCSAVGSSKELHRNH